MQSRLFKNMDGERLAHNMSRFARLGLSMLAAWLSVAAQAHEPCVQQPDGSAFCLDQPAQRVISLAPHLTEMLFAIGAQDRIVGVVDRSDHPVEAQSLPNVGAYHSPDLERLISLHPDLIIAWASGTPAAQVSRLRELGLKVWITRGEQLDDVPRELRQLGRLTGKSNNAEQAANAFEQELATLTAMHANSRKLNGFYEIWPQPLITVSNRHFIGQAMQRCGIRNIVGDTSSATPTWSEEAVVRARPELMLTSPPARDFNRWRRWTDLPAVQKNALIVLPADVLMRPGPRLIEGVRALCEAADTLREKADD